MTYGQQIFRSWREAAEVEYLKAVRRIFIEPVILIDASHQEERRRRITPDLEPGGLPKVYVTVTIASRSLAARKVAALSISARGDRGRSIRSLHGCHPHPERGGEGFRRALRATRAQVS